jgi:hypothetical protein
MHGHLGNSVIHQLKFPQVWYKSASLVSSFQQYPRTIIATAEEEAIGKVT